MAFIIQAALFYHSVTSLNDCDTPKNFFEPLRNTPAYRDNIYFYQFLIISSFKNLPYDQRTF